LYFSAVDGFGVADFDCFEEFFAKFVAAQRPAAPDLRIEFFVDGWLLKGLPLSRLRKRGTPCARKFLSRKRRSVGRLRGS
jgi:hypothetical protein